MKNNFTFSFLKKYLEKSSIFSPSLIEFGKMEPLDFLPVADKLKDSSNEAERRTAVSRAYYAVFNFVKSYLVQNRIPFSSSGEHGQLTRYLFNSGIKEVEQLSRMIDDLRTDRNEADYNMDSTRFNQNTCILLYLKAQKVIEVFQRCKGRNIIEGINKYRSRIGQA
jgi:uncharacterized protein (UPF0332 family)